MAAPIGFGNWQQTLDEIIESNDREKSKLFNSFQNLHKNESRVSFIFKHHMMRDVSWLPTYFKACSSWHGKSKVEAAFWKAKGNKFFQQKKFALAVEAYTQSCINAPVSEDDLPLSLGNRSAALFHLTHYKSCVTDIERAVSCKFPAASLHKLLARKTWAFIKLGQKDEAERSLQVLRGFVESAQFSLQGQKKDDFVKEMDLMTQSIHALKKPTSTNDVKDRPVKPPAVFAGANKVISQASESVALAFSPQKGRHLLANRAIPRGSTLIVEKPFAAVLLPDHYETHCHHCFSPLPLTCIGCQRCTSVKFCNESCREAAWTSYHATECPYLDLLHSVGIAHLSLRVVLCAGLPFLTAFLEHQSDHRLSTEPASLGLNREGRYERDYLAVFDLMTHEESTEGADMLQYSMTAGLLLLTLAHAGFFSAPDEAGDSRNRNSSQFVQAVLEHGEAPSGITISPEMSQVGGLLLRHILQLVCNAHAITSIQADPLEGEECGDVSGTEQTRVATAIYPTASLMNHSCDPTIVSSFIGDTLIVRTVKDVGDGEEIYNCYGPHYCRMDRAERQMVLQSQYRFSCDCTACQGAGVDHRRFGAYKCPRCAGVLSDSTCLECSFTADAAAMASLKTRSARTREMFGNAVGLMNAQQFQAALAMFEQCGEQRREFLYKDHRDLALVQDAMARCSASLGDFCSAADHLEASVEFARLLYGLTSPEYGHELHKLAEVLYNAGRMRECADVSERCLRLLSDLYPPGQQVVREVGELLSEARQALVPQVDKR